MREFDFPKVLMIANTAWYLFNFRSSTISAIISAGCSVVCIAPEDEYQSKLVELGAKFIGIPMSAASTKPLEELKFLKELFQHIRVEQPNIIFNFTIKVNVYSGMCARFLGIPYVNNVSGLGTAFIHSSISFRLARILYGLSNRGAARVFFQNSEDKDHFIKRGLVSLENAVLIPGSGVDVGAFCKTPFPDGKLTFLMISRLIADKGVREFVSAATIFNKFNPGEARFILLGSNDVKNHSAISDEELNTWRHEGLVELPGLTVDVRPWLKSCHVFVLPSYREGMPRTVLEAAAIGRPAIVTDAPGCRQSIVDGETGWLCEIGSAESLALKMKYVSENRHLLEEFGNRASERVRREFSEDIVIKEYLRCLDFMNNN